MSRRALAIRSWIKQQLLHLDSGASNPVSFAPKVKIPTEFTLAGLRPAGIDGALRAEKQGSKPPASKPSWREYWEECISAWNAYHRPDYEEYFRKHRKQLGLTDFNKL